MWTILAFVMYCHNAVRLFCTVTQIKIFLRTQQRSGNISVSYEKYSILLTYSTEQSPSWGANRFSAIQETPRILWNLKVHYCIHKCPPRPYPNPAWSNPYPHIMKILILSSHLHQGIQSGLFPSGFPTKTLYMPLLSLIRTTCPAHLILLSFITWTILGEC
jgi:hypothetical protein